MYNGTVRLTIIFAVGHNAEEWSPVRTRTDGEELFISISKTYLSRIEIANIKV